MLLETRTPVADRWRATDRRRLARIFVAVAVCLATPPALAQIARPAVAPPARLAQLPDLDGSLAGSPEADAVISVEAYIARGAQGTDQLVVVAQVKSPWHIYSITQAAGGPIASKITLDPSADYQLAGGWTAEPAADRHAEPLFDNLVVETHAGQVTWRAPLRWAASADPARAEVQGQLLAQACSDSSCNPPEEFAFTARLRAGATAASGATAPASAPPQAPASVGSYQKRGTHTKIWGEADRGAVPAGGRVWLTLRAEPGPGFHVYGLEAAETEGVSKPTLWGWQDLAGLSATAPEASQPPVEKRSEVDGQLVRYYEGEVAWRVAIDVPAGFAPGKYRLAGVLGYQACTDSSCEPPLGTRFELPLEVVAAGSTAEAQTVPLEFFEARYSDAAKLVSDGGLAPAPQRPAPESAPGPVAAGSPRQWFPQLEPHDLSARHTDLWGVFLAALAGGFLLNFMPCVLPVVGLKILAFVHQSGQRRGEAFLLNLWYSLGVIAVFLLLATAATALNLSWGQQFTSTWFNVTLSAVVFAMGLSFLGVWELPIPGLAGGSTAGQLAAREGAAGAFFKGALSTVLATPCSGPFLGPVFGFTLTVPPYVTYAVFAAIGLGMASPYLLIGAFPRLIRFLPKPGAWMDTFKNVMGFVMLGTVVYLFSFMNRDYLVATFALLVGVWAACWLIGRTPITASPVARSGAWLGGAAIVAVVGGLAFQFLVPRAELLAWQPFSAQHLAELTRGGNTVLVDFTADWCLTCKTNEAVALNTAEVHRWVEQNHVVTLKADWTEPSDEIKEMLALLGSNSIPVYAIFPADRPNRPLVLRDLVTKGQILSALRSAGPSRARETATAALDR